MEDVLDAMRQPGCPICRISNARVARHLDRLLYEQVNDGGIRSEIRASLGFCSRHAWQLMSLPTSPGLGIAIIYKDVLDELAQALRGATPTSAGPVNWGDMVRRMRRRPPPANLPSPEASCPVCVYQHEIEMSALGALIDAFDTEPVSAEYALAQSHGLCWVHLRAMLSQEAPGIAGRALMDDARYRIGQFENELAEYIRHFDYQASKDQAGPWKGAARRILAYVHGERGLQ